MMLHCSYNGINGDYNANGDNGFNGTSGVIGTNGAIEWRCVFQISHESLHIEINDTIGTLYTNYGVNEANELPSPQLDRQCYQWRPWRQWSHWRSLAFVELEDTSPRNGANGAILIAPLVTNGDRHWCQWWSPLVPMVIVISTNGDRHWYQWWSSSAPMAMGCTTGAINSIAIGANESSLAPFLIAIGANGKNSKWLWRFYRNRRHIAINDAISANDTTGAIGSNVACGIIFAIGTIGIIEAIVNIATIVLLYGQCIVIVCNGLSLLPILPLPIIVTIGAINFHRIFKPSHRHEMASMEPFKKMAPLITNGDRVRNWRHLIYHHWCQWIAISTIFCHPMTYILMTLLPKY